MASAVPVHPGSGVYACVHVCVVFFLFLFLFFVVVTTALLRLSRSSL